MNYRLRTAFLGLIVVQAIHSVEEFIYGLYERFPPMKFVYQNISPVAKPAFVIFNTLLVLIGLFCFYHWVRPARKGARVVVWVSIILESFNVTAHVLWAILSREYNPGLTTAILFVPVIAYLSYLMKRMPKYGIAEQAFSSGLWKGDVSRGEGADIIS